MPITKIKCNTCDTSWKGYPLSEKLKKPHPFQESAYVKDKEILLAARYTNRRYPIFEFKDIKPSRIKDGCICDACISDLLKKGLIIYWGDKNDKKEQHSDE